MACQEAFAEDGLDGVADVAAQGARTVAGVIAFGGDEVLGGTIIYSE